ncbi:transcription initiation factor IIA subunit 1-like [Physella acuta]|uniref:transcription initiation factor IIA subunit 1-like n=1 Tax=Physella acuta TaxID=109671 RepID=UPI0027DDAF64|nr:transcription initiation factor IIA subunit 1-like [Physella acuta]
MSTAGQVTKLYHTVVEDVINNVKEAFLDESVDEQVLQELKQLWESKLAASKALEPPEQDLTIKQHVSTILPMQAQAQNEQVLAQPNQIQTAQYQISTPSGAMSLPAGLFQQQVAALRPGPGGQFHNVTVRQTGTGQYIIQQPQQLAQFQQQGQQLAQVIQQSPQNIRLPGQQQIIVTQQQHLQLQQQHLQHQHLQQQQKLLQQNQMLQQNQTTLPSNVNKSQGGIHQTLIQLDGNCDTSSSDDDDFDDDDKDEDDEKEEENEEEEPGEKEDSLNSGDDVSEDDPTELFDTENVVVCQYDKINRNKNKWKFHLKDGIMNLNGRDFVFQKATGDAEW